MPVTDQTFFSVAQTIQALLANKNFSPSSLEDIIYRLLTQKQFDAQLLTQEFAVYKQVFFDTLDSIHLEPYGTINTNPAWFELAPVRGDAFFEAKNDEHGFFLTHKRYYSLEFPQAPARVLVEYILMICNSLQELFMQLYALGYHNNSRISLKIPGTLIGFLVQHDTLVVHFRNKVLSKDIDTIVKNHFKKHDIHYKQRMHRVDEGFDLQNEAVKKGSHSRLIAMLLTDHIIKHQQSLTKITQEELIIWLKECLKTITAWDAQTFASTLHKR